MSDRVIRYPSANELGEMVRKVWIAWAKEQPSPKASWLAPWKDLSESDKDVDRRIGLTLFRAGAEAALFDPDALPLSVAMRLARERTEAGAETWIQVPHAPKPFLLRHAPDENPYHGEWVCGDVLTGGHIAWGWVTFEADVIESAACRLVTPEEGERLLKGEM